MTNSHLQSLNPAQLDAVQHKDGPILVLAGAGTGKTRVLTNRIAHLVLEHKIPPWQILAVTFTNKATEEMQKRLKAMLGPDADDLWISTFHSAALRLLRRHYQELGFTSRFSVYDEQDSRTLMKNLLKELGFDAKKTAPQAFLARIDQLKGNYILPSEFKKSASSREQRDAVVYEEYQRALFRSDAMDFGDLLMHAVTLLMKFPALLESYRRKIHYVLVDEYQDTNHVQYLFLTLLAKPRNNVLVVGDDDQAIYSFRGASIRNILDFEKDFPGAKIVRLEENYRSTSIILHAANEVIARNTQRKGKDLWTGHEGGDPIRLFAGYDETDEATFVCEEIKKQRESAASFRDIAIFYRTNAQSRALEECLLTYRIPYRIFGGMKFYERKEIKDVLAYLRLLLNEADREAFMRIVNTPPRGIGPKTVEGVVELANEKNISLVAAARELSKRQKGLHAFTALMDLARTAVPSVSIVDLIDLILDKSDYLKSLQEMKDPVAESRIENLKELRGVAFALQQRDLAPLEQLQAFLDRIALTTSSENPQNGAGNVDDYVSLMTLHLAKGLEFPVVFLTGMEEGLLPHYRSISEELALEEERRLCYVGITRAMRRLYLTRANTRGMFAGDDGGVSTGYYRYASRFLSDVPRETLSEDSSAFLEVSDPWELEDSLLDSLEFDSKASPVSFPDEEKPKKGRRPARNKTYAATEVPKNIVSGSLVYHPTFGRGIVDRVEGDPEDEAGMAVITVQFDDFEEPMKLVHKWSRLSLAE